MTQEIDLSINDTDLVYNWSTIQAPQGAPEVTFTPNNTNEAKNTVATVGKDGSYVFEVSTSHGFVVKTPVNGLDFDPVLGLMTIRSNAFTNVVLIRVSPFDPTLINVTLSGTGQDNKPVVNQSQAVPVTQLKSIYFDARDTYILTFTNATLVPCTVYGGKIVSGIYGGGGGDRLIGGIGSNTIRGGDGDDYIVGGAGTNYLYGGSGKNTIIPGPGPGLSFIFPSS